MQQQIASQLRLLYRIDPTTMRSILPPPFAAIEQNGFGVAGIDFERIVRDRGNGTGVVVDYVSHWFAVESEVDGVICRYMPRRDTNSHLDTLYWNNGHTSVLNQSDIEREEKKGTYSYTLQSNAKVALLAEKGSHQSALFASPQAMVAYLAPLTKAYYPTDQKGLYEGLDYDAVFAGKLDNIKPLVVSHQHSNLFSVNDLFPEESIQFDSAYRMPRFEQTYSELDILIVSACQADFVDTFAPHGIKEEYHANLTPENEHLNKPPAIPLTDS